MARVEAFRTLICCFDLHFAASDLSPTLMVFGWHSVRDRSASFGLWLQRLLFRLDHREAMQSGRSLDPRDPSQFPITTTFRRWGTNESVEVGMVGMVGMVGNRPAGMFSHVFLCNLTIRHRYGDIQVAHAHQQ